MTFLIVVTGILVYYYIGCLFSRTDGFFIGELAEYIESKTGVAFMTTDDTDTRPLSVGKELGFIFGWPLLTVVLVIALVVYLLYVLLRKVVLVLLKIVFVRVLWEKAILAPFNWARESK